MRFKVLKNKNTYNKTKQKNQITDLVYCLQISLQKNMANRKILAWFSRAAKLATSKNMQEVICTEI